MTKRHDSGKYIKNIIGIAPLYRSSFAYLVATQSNPIPSVELSPNGQLDTQTNRLVTPRLLSLTSFCLIALRNLGIRSLFFCLCYCPLPQHQLRKATLCPRNLNWHQINPLKALSVTSYLKLLVFRLFHFYSCTPTNSGKIVTFKEEGRNGTRNSTDLFQCKS